MSLMKLALQVWHLISKSPAIRRGQHHCDDQAQKQEGEQRGERRNWDESNNNNNDKYSRGTSDWSNVVGNLPELNLGKLFDGKQ